ncbi:MAG TPA: ABC transporter ATP-binding protein [Candidatus Scatovicinus merdipullorum]|nr:ABC transporter ATP-binding protein [Candidatus Scatovicinus merdipullorum]
MRKLFPFLKDYKLQLTIGPLCKLLEAVFELIVPLVMASIIDTGVANRDTAYIYKMGGVMLLLGAVGLASALVCQKSASIASQGSGTKLRTALFAHINKLSFQELDKIGTPSLITRMTNDINQLQLAVAMLIRLVIRAPFLVIGAIAMSFTIHAGLAFVFVIAAVLIAAILYLVMSRSVPFFKLVQKKLDKISLLARENLSGSRVIRAFGKQREEQARFNTSADELAKTAVRVGKLSALLNPMTYVVTNLAIVAVVWFGAGLVDTGDMLPGEIIALVNYMTQILLAMVVVANLVVIFTKASASAARINEVFETRPSVQEPAQANTAPVLGAPKIEFRDVSFGYGGEQVLRHIDLKVQKGQTLGIIGTTGSGKSTLVNLIPRFYDVLQGEVLVDGVNVKEYPLSLLRGQCGIAPQNAVLFSGTIGDNMRWAKEDATDQEIERALSIAQAEDFVKKLPFGIDTPITQGGKNLSGGQKQRLTIARALLRDPQILILDDSASALDFVTDAALRRAIRTQTKDMTVLLVSQRVSTVRGADQIAVLDDGTLAGVGSHEELFASCKPYREICLSQLSRQEVSAG